MKKRTKKRKGYTYAKSGNEKRTGREEEKKKVCPYAPSITA